MGVIGLFYRALSAPSPSRRDAAAAISDTLHARSHSCTCSDPRSALSGRESNSRFLMCVIGLFYRALLAPSPCVRDWERCSWGGDSFKMSCSVVEVKISIYFHYFFIQSFTLLLT